MASGVKWRDMARYASRGASARSGAEGEGEKGDQRVARARSGHCAARSM